jgi:hypothetical protein
MSQLSIESSSWNNDYARHIQLVSIQQKIIEVLRWQEKIRRQKRPYLFSFASVPRPNLQDFI